MLVVLYTISYHYFWHYFWINPCVYFCHSWVLLRRTKKISSFLLACLSQGMGKTRKIHLDFKISISPTSKPLIRTIGSVESLCPELYVCWCFRYHKAETEKEKKTKTRVRRGNASRCLSIIGLTNYRIRVNCTLVLYCDLEKWKTWKLPLH